MPFLLVLVAGAADAGSGFNTDWALPSPFTFNGRVTCDVPDAGISITIFHEPEWLAMGDDCVFSPFTCSTTAARDEVLRAYKAGTLKFPEPRAIVHPDADGWLKTEMRDGEALFVECGPLADVVPFWPLQSHDIHLSAGGATPELGEDIEKIVLVNPFSREVHEVTRAQFAQLPRRATAGAWAAAQDKAHRWSAPVFNPSYWAEFPPEDNTPPFHNAWGFDGGVEVTVLLEAPGIKPAATGISAYPASKRSPSAMTPDLVSTMTRSNGARFFLKPGQWSLSINMKGARRLLGEITVADRPQELTVELNRGLAGVVVDEAGKPVERACVSDADNGRCAAWSDRNGEFTLEADGYTTWARATHGNVGSSSKVPVKTGVPIKLKLKATNKVTLRIPAIDGHVTRGWVEVDPVEITPGFEQPSPGQHVAFEGNVTLADLKPGKHSVVISAPNQQSQRIEVVAQKQGSVTVRVPPWTPKPPASPTK